MTKIIVNNVVDDNIDGLHNIVIHASVTAPISMSDNNELGIMLEHELTKIFKHDYEIFIEGKTVSRDFFMGFIDNMFSQINNLTIVYKIGDHIDEAILALIKNGIGINNDLTDAIIDVMF